MTVPLFVRRAKKFRREVAPSQPGSTPDPSPLALAHARLLEAQDRLKAADHACMTPNKGNDLDLDKALSLANSHDFACYHELRRLVLAACGAPENLTDDQLWNYHLSVASYREGGFLYLVIPAIAHEYECSMARVIVVPIA